MWKVRVTTEFLKIPDLTIHGVLVSILETSGSDRTQKNKRALPDKFISKIA